MIFRRAYLLLLIASTFCSQGSATAQESLVLTTLPPQAALIERIAAGKFAVRAVIPAEANHEQFDASSRELGLVDSAVAYFALGHSALRFERNILPRLVRAGGKISVFQMSASCESDPSDPHLWLSIPCARQMARNVARDLTALRPSDAAAFQEALQGYLAEIDSLEQELRASLGPLAGQSFLTFHPAYGYVARDWRLEQLAVEQEGKETDIRQLTHIMNLARQRSVKSVLAEPEVPSQTREIIAKQLDAQVVVMNPMEADWMGHLRRFAEVMAGAPQP